MQITNSPVYTNTYYTYSSKVLDKKLNDPNFVTEVLGLYSVSIKPNPSVWEEIAQNYNIDKARYGLP